MSEFRALLSRIQHIACGRINASEGRSAPTESDPLATNQHHLKGA